MVKKLRSLLQEKIPLETRVQIELISKRRDLLPKEKFEEVIKLLQGANIENIVPLGPGTNRFAFKLNGFVIKVATNDEGKIDNLKEFKMAKRLYPYVIKVYEVSTNGDLLVCEYVQPFMSYSEMCVYSAQIKDILKELSSVYLIGDVGINPQNYGNWGLRLGTNNPVCLDFAYVYSCSSELFKCTDIKCGGIMVPDDDFFALYCNRCKRKYTFQDIRARLGNDLHSLEIGDLTQEGYEMTESESIRELDLERSNYLSKNDQRSNTKNVEETEENCEIPFVMDRSSKCKKQEETSMFENVKVICKTMVDEGKIKIPASAKSKFKSNAGEVPVNVEVIDDKHNIIVGNTTVTVVEDNKDDNVEEADDGVAFSAIISTDAVIVKDSEESAEVDDSEDIEEDTEVEDAEVSEDEEDEETAEVDESEDIKSQKIEEVDVKSDDVASSQHTPSNTVPETTVTTSTNTAKTEESAEETQQPVVHQKYAYLEYATSKLSYKISNWAHAIELFDQVRNDIPDKRMYPETFYKIISSCCYNSILIFLGFTSEEYENKNGKGTRKRYIAPDNVDDSVKDTVTFLSRFWGSKKLNAYTADKDIMDEYKKMFNDKQGLQPEIMDMIRKYLIQKTRITVMGANIVIDTIKSTWCASETVDEPIVLVTHIEEDAEVSEDEEDEETAEVDESEDVVDEDEDDEDDEEEDEDDDEASYISVYIYYGEYKNAIRVNTTDCFGSISIPIYADIDDVDLSKEHHSLVDDRNGVWDWLIHRQPDFKFTTNDPERWLGVNNIECDPEIGMTRIVILDSDKDNGVYTMGLYYLDGVYMIDKNDHVAMVDDEQIYAKINRIITENTSFNSISHLKLNLSNACPLRDESYLENLIESAYTDADEKEVAAMEAILGNIVTRASSDDDMIFDPIHKK